ncbi:MULTISPECIES: 16S rRNA (uracil(1498)-N(3))-methyltransferase [unclassified Actinomyces]|uniref:16S rRNA (uracil(1498)-N(3))-methyltransferase n=1 Tax=unclassified Actinomyces TaxID=2609248 RepID=UPI002017E39D|nr:MULTISPECIES: 16S rRNA (uracil(1498)-N(3))-methyltransferase [unclassified Actinomyces]MCL3776569.1 16S rRNA (uracil(1498)-N(3))-methyltransferase [Actinomyces sp. AC-20-1]MCL3788855.1 16S rRNA (uracil(1498)-N(3))-methyltransferase [Actinomyces sp. 187325]MCL3791039.1 16S rRNA (uracil(1498)-N(3))-methyltransferase [Actinomyces sp. 186855]MCL3793435.1 16S rRNA (uracil(1498)-N(3))-methyltransferase [Actinomyces sp. 217892]
MTAPVFVLTADTLEPAGAGATAQAGTLLVLTGPEARHAVTVRRLRSGERVDLVDGQGLRLVCEVTGPGAGGAKDRLGVRVVERVEEPEAPVRLTLVQALAKGGRDEQAVETATEVGVDLVLPWQAGRCVSVWNGPKAAKGRARWETTAREAAKQARRARVPVVEDVRSTARLCDWVRRTVDAGGVVLVLHEEGTAPVGGATLPTAAPGAGAGEPPVLGVVVGPEGGISGEERAALEAAGASTVRLGPHVMRTASAGPVALAVLAQHTGLWG